jgi:carboxyl-terminal processing protease
LTTARYYTPNGRSIQATGITPDIVMESVPVSLGEGRKLPSIREQNLPRHLEKESPPGRDGQDTDDDGDFDPALHGRLGEEGVPDPQLERALELLKSWNVFKTVVAQRQP